MYDSAQMMDGSYRNKRPWHGIRNLLGGGAGGAGAAESKGREAGGLAEIMGQ